MLCWAVLCLTSPDSQCAAPAAGADSQPLTEEQVDIDGKGTASNALTSLVLLACFDRLHAVPSDGRLHVAQQTDCSNQVPAASRFGLVPIMRAWATQSTDHLLANNLGFAMLRRIATDPLLYSQRDLASEARQVEGNTTVWTFFCSDITALEGMLCLTILLYSAYSQASTAFRACCDVALPFFACLCAFICVVHALYCCFAVFPMSLHCFPTQNTMHLTACLYCCSVLGNNFVSGH